MQTTTCFHSNLKFLRLRKETSQQALADFLQLKRTTLSAYENQGSEPSLSALISISDYFGFTIDLLLREDLRQWPEKRLQDTEKATKMDFSGKRLRVVATTVDKFNKEFIEVVSVRARAGYMSGFADPEFVKELPKYQMPFLDKNKTYRTFQISGDSMPPVANGEWVTGVYAENWNELKDGQRCILLLKDDGIVFKHVYKLADSKDKLLLVSQNPVYAPFEVEMESVKEIWLYDHHLSRLDV